MLPLRPSPRTRSRKGPDAKKLGVIGAVPGMIGCLQALEAVKYLTGTGELLVGRFLSFDGQAMDFEIVELPPDPDCPACGKT